MIEPTESIYNSEDVNKMLDSLLREAAPWWNEFYSDREKGIPFFVNAPDENLVQYFDSNTLIPGRVLELGCGPGRNAIYMAQKGCEVDAVDLSQEALTWAKERASSLDVNVRFHCANVFDMTFTPNSYDLIYDSGCLHHIAPHRRISYIDMIRKTLKPGGCFGLTCFVYGEQGAQITDWEVYRLRSLKVGLGYTEQKLRTLFHDFQVVELRRMIRQVQPNPLFGESFLWTALFQKQC
ncbi:class I SAM-dependent methyltransferase [Paenibacillus radicis (ex Xue et al. 2023)]|uniref:Class I SAM-dependent methyltransferase n=1 Tax=Paenibacillus radicis (ex Xue et al. 2023) TaxID=2972489 RepID=A0ABT1YQC1_9BACL|nr:class I SAM-dependent methyltransferase [Paenibacillus radicis (ex Xue et al. 2023)]MCR8634940.1 class I SAM-dependent methyltransferase [Paenibacillus radicis (ex Xue et al. 2023)]